MNDPKAPPTQGPLSNLSLLQQVSWGITTEPEGPSPRLPSRTITVAKKQETAKQKAHCEAALAETIQQMNNMIREYFDLSFLSPEPKREL